MKHRSGRRPRRFRGRLDRGLGFLNEARTYLSRAQVRRRINRFCSLYQPEALAELTRPAPEKE